MQELRDKLLSYSAYEDGPLETQCLIWLRSTLYKGYGQIGFNKKRLLTHRASYEAFSGVIPENTCVLHRCDNPRCINPEHLFLGSKGDNIKDMISKGRRSFIGSANAAAVLNEDLVKELRSLSPNMSIASVARKYGLNYNTVYNAIKGNRWRHI